MLQEFAEQVEKAAKTCIWDIHTSIPGKILSFDSVKCTVSVQPSGKYVTVDGAELDYPVIPDAPVLFPCSTSSGIGIAFPVKPGDSCLIVISEAELDEWRTGAESEAHLRFDLTNAVVIPGLMSSGNAPLRKAIREEAIVLNAKNMEIVVSEGRASVRTDGVEMTVSGDRVSVTGNLAVSGNITATGDVSAGSVSLRGHRHPGVHGPTGSAY